MPKIEIVSPELLAEAKSQYDSNGLAFHNWAHIEFCLRELTRYGFKAGFFVPIEARLALIFHDIIYHPGSKDNERHSIIHCGATLTARGYSAETVRRACEFIGCTSRKIVPDECDIWGRVVCDIDYAILGQSEPMYRRYASQIAEEFFSLPAREFLDGRKRFLSKRLTGSIYHTGFFGRAYEAAARRNMRAELEALNWTNDL